MCMAGHRVAPEVLIALSPCTALAAPEAGYLRGRRWMSGKIPSIILRVNPWNARGGKTENLV